MSASMRTCIVRRPTVIKQYFGFTSCQNVLTGGAFQRKSIFTHAARDNLKKIPIYQCGSRWQQTKGFHNSSALWTVEETANEESVEDDFHTIIKNTERSKGPSDKLEFQAETRKLLDIVARSLYSEKEVFIRELISNSSDALEKLRYKQMADGDIEDSDLPLEIDIAGDETKKTITIQDTGFGMTREEMVKNLGTIAHSGSKAFLDSMKDSSDASKNIIGQFGVGFYSSFMVGNKVDVYSKSCIPGSQAYKWSSDGTGTFELAEAEGVQRGTKIVIHLKPESHEFCVESYIKDVITKYSNFVGVDIYLNGKKVNVVQALWTLEPRDVTEEMHEEFYRLIANSYDIPRYSLHYKTDAPLNIRAIFYVPKYKPSLFDMSRETEVSLQLYSRKVMIMSKSNTILPKWLRFMKGCTTYEAVFDYKGELSTHLQLKQGDLVRVHRKEAAGWWRGTAGDQTGWFPNNYVQAAPPDNFKTENEVEMHDDSYVSSFMVKRSEEPNQRQSCLLNELNHRKSYLVNEPNHRKSAQTEEEIQAEPIYCKIQPKDKRKSGVDRSNSTTPTKSDIISSIKDTSLDEDTQYVALYPFVARVDTELTINKGDIILCKECGDKNGWMRGINDSTKLEGWVPATYVKKVDKVEKVEKPKLDLDPSSYKQLEVNVDMDERQDLVGIVHKAIHTFSAEKAGDLEFDTGDHITVFQVLENGWWLGCKDKTVGWFPGTFVEMIDQSSASPSPSPASSNQSPSQSPVPSEDSQPLLNDVPKNLQQSDVKPATQSKLKPVRKAPAPPTPKSPKSSEPHETDTNVPQVEKKPESKLPTPGGSRLPKMSRPKVAPPLPPTKHSTDLHDPLYDVIEKPDHKNDVNTNISDKHVPNNNDSNIVKQNGPTSDGLYELIKPPENGPNCVSTPKKGKIKPPVPKRFIKPKLVTVPKAEVQMPNKETLTKGLVNGDVMKLRPPPPPRPVAPKLGPIRAKLSEPKPLEDQIPSEEEDTFFNLTPQRKFDAFVCQDLDEQDVAVTGEDDPYQTLSSFGVSYFAKPRESSFGKSKEIKPLNIIDNNQNIPIHGRIKDNDSENIAELNADINKDYINALGSCEDASPRNEVQDQNVHAENIVNEVKNEVIIKEKDNPDDTTAENQPKAKMGIPVTPKMKASRLAPPKPVSAKISEPNDEAYSEKTASSPPEKTSKLQKPTKVGLSSKIPLSPKESPRKKPDEPNVFHYPDSAKSSNDVENVDDKGTVLYTSPKGKSDSVHANPQHVIQNTGNMEKMQRTESFETEKQNKNIENKPRTESFEKRPRADSMENRLRADSMENRLRADSMEKRLRADSIENRPRTDSIENRPRTDSIENRARTDSIGKPPVAPKPKSGLPKLAKPSSIGKTKEEPVDENVYGNSPRMENNNSIGKSPINEGQSSITNKKSPGHDVLPPSGIEPEAKHVPSPIIENVKTRLSESESDTENKNVNSKSKSITPGSKLPHISAKTQQSPKSRGRKSNLPSPGFRNKSVDGSDRNVNEHKLSESESDGPMSPNLNIKRKPESPAPGRKASSKQVGSVEKQSLRNRSNSPAGRSGIPTTMRNRSNSPAPKPAGIPVATTNTPKNKQRGLVPPKKILNGQDTNGDSTSPTTSNLSNLPALNSPVKDDKNEPENDSLSPKPDRPSKPPRIQKQKSQDSKPPKHGKSLLPVIHKAIETGSGSPNWVSQTTPGTKPKRGIPVAKPTRPETSPKASPTDQGEEIKRTLYQAVRGYTAQIDGELTFSEGTFIKELSDCDRPGWYVGMLADGTTGLYPADYFKPSPVSAQSEA